MKVEIGSSLVNSPQINSDVQAETRADLPALNWVGMSQIQSAAVVHGLTLPLQLDVGVNLKSGYRGIHMSRLYQAHLEQFLNKAFSSQTVSKFLSEALKSQNELSDEIAAKAALKFPIHTVSLKSGLAGYRYFPVVIVTEMNTQASRTWVQFEVLYSSTCPQSASLSMELLNAFETVPQSLPGTPHAQRSRALVQVEISGGVQWNEITLADLIQNAEKALKTPVQTSVKKADEMEFARLNAENLMFCEDAARILARELSKNKAVAGFNLLCEHFESLHPHNASASLRANWVAPTALQL